MLIDQLDYDAFWDVSKLYAPILFFSLIMASVLLYCVRFRVGAVKWYWAHQKTLSGLISNRSARLIILSCVSYIVLLAPIVVIGLYASNLHRYVEPTLSATNLALICSFSYFLFVTMGLFFMNGFFTSKSFKILLSTTVLLLALQFIIPSFLHPSFTNYRTFYLGFAIINMLFLSAAVYASLPFPRVDPVSVISSKSSPSFTGVMNKRSLVLWGASIIVLIIFDLVSLTLEDRHPAFSFFSLGAIILLDFLSFLHKWSSPTTLIFVLFLSRLALILPGPDYFFLGHTLLSFIILTAGSLSYFFKRFPLSTESTEAALKSMTKSNEATGNRPIVWVSSLPTLHHPMTMVVLLFFAFVGEIVVMLNLNFPLISMLRQDHEQYIFGVVSLFSVVILSIWTFALLFFIRQYKNTNCLSKSIMVPLCCYLGTSLLGFPLWMLTGSYINTFTLLFTFPLLFSLVYVYFFWEFNNNVIISGNEAMKPLLILFSPLFVSLIYAGCLMFTVKPLFVGYSVMTFLFEGVLIGYAFVSFFKTLNFRPKQELLLCLSAVIIHMIWGSVSYFGSTQTGPIILIVFTCLPPLILLCFSLYDFYDRSFQPAKSTLVTFSIGLGLFTVYGILLTFFFSPWYFGASVLGVLYSILFISFIAFNIRQQGYFPPSLKTYTFIYTAIATIIALYVGGRGEGIFWGSSLCLFIIIGVCFLYSFSLKPINTSSPVVSSPWLFPSFCLTDNGQFLTVNLPKLLSVLGFVILTLWGTFASLWMEYYVYGPLIVAGVAVLLLANVVGSSVTLAPHLLGSKAHLISSSVVSENLAEECLDGGSWKPSWGEFAVKYLEAIEDGSDDEVPWSLYNKFTNLFQGDVSTVLKISVKLIQAADANEFSLLNNLSLFLASTGRSDLTAKDVAGLDPSQRASLIADMEKWMSQRRAAEQEEEKRRREEEEIERRRRNVVNPNPQPTPISQPSPRPQPSQPSPRPQPEPNPNPNSVLPSPPQVPVPSNVDHDDDERSSRFQQQQNEQERRRKLLLGRKKKKGKAPKKEKEVVKKQDNPVVAQFDNLASKLKQGGQKFSDSDFPAGDAIAGRSVATRLRSSNWSRVGHNSTIFKGDPSCDHVKQGVLGDCWLISAIAVICTKPNLVTSMFVRDYGSNGMYVLRFHKNCTWTYIAIDDYLPLRSDGRPAFAHSSQPQEMFPALIEKGYAKLHGTYEAIEGGQVSIGLSDLTGGIADSIKFTSKETKSDIASGAFWRKVVNYMESGYLLGAGSPSGSDTDTSDFGIVQGHAYSIHRVAEPERGLQLIQLRNPWGRTEWNGAYSDHCPKWTSKLKKRLDMKAEDDGTFWMEFSDFVVHFSTLYICRFFTNSYEARIQSAWTRNPFTAGGCQTAKNRDTFKSNPQFVLSCSGPGKCGIVLRQDDRRMLGEEPHHIGFYVCQAGGNRISAVTNTNFFAKTSFINLREVFKEIDVEANGSYTIVPCTFDANCENGFTLMAFGDHDVSICEI
ncbi:hypothetical protein P9112_007527 [Eukaryota sp. TZLM1-RC]